VKRLADTPFEINVDKWTFKVPRDRVYNENDCWAKLDGHVATVGITDFLQNMASDIIYVELPDLGTAVEQFDEAGSFEAIKTILDLISPVSGVVQEVNEELRAKPELVNQEPYEGGWFIKVATENFEADRENLIDANAYFEVLKRKVEAERLKLKGKAGQ
jgi:glycine cleavage system H protein